jgi:hypothetical protein
MTASSIAQALHFANAQDTCLIEVYLECQGDVIAHPDRVTYEQAYEHIHGGRIPGCVRCQGTLVEFGI